MKLPFYQSSAWRDFLVQLGDTTFFSSTPDFSYLATLESTPFGPYLYLPCGPYVRQKNALQPCLEALQGLAKQKKAMFIRIEPEDRSYLDFWRQIPGCRKSRDLHPAHTWLLDLTPDFDTILAHMKPNNRNIFRNYRKKSLSIRTSRSQSDLDAFIALQKTVSARNHIIPPSPQYLSTLLNMPFSTLYLAEFDQQIIAGALFFDHAGTRYYNQAAANDTYRKLSAGTALLAQAIFDAKSENFHTFDFWGIAPDDAPADHPWAGFTKFKKSFGGYPLSYCGTYDLVLQPHRYRPYLAFRQLNRRLRRLHH